jgi:hypothetical protein
MSVHRIRDFATRCLVIPAKAGIQRFDWAPAFAGATALRGKG